MLGAGDLVGVRRNKRVRKAKTPGATGFLRPPPLHPRKARHILPSPPVRSRGTHGRRPRGGAPRGGGGQAGGQAAQAQEGGPGGHQVRRGGRGGDGAHPPRRQAAHRRGQDARAGAPATGVGASLPPTTLLCGVQWLGATPQHLLTPTPHLVILGIPRNLCRQAQVRVQGRRDTAGALEKAPHRFRGARAPPVVWGEHGPMLPSPCPQMRPINPTHVEQLRKEFELSQPQELDLAVSRDRGVRGSPSCSSAAGWLGVSAV